MIQRKLESFMARRRCTLLGVGPMSKNCVDVTIELANNYKIPLMLIASRRQIDSARFDGGYVNNWTTEKYAKYVIDRDKRGMTILARDHGGPWQNTNEKDQNMSLRQAMASAKKSFEDDIKSGFEIIHIDPSIDIHGSLTVDDILERACELLDYCCEIAKREKKEIIFEIGTEEQSGGTNTMEEFEYSLNEVFKFCKKNKIQNPSFIVVQTGTKVMEMRNIGSFNSPFRIVNELPAEIQIPKVIELCNKYNIFMKEHNTDYLSDEALKWHPKFGIHSANVAPEYGLAETQGLVELLEANNMKKLVEKFLKISFDSKKWEKWMLPNTKATDRERALIAGHYVFSKPEVIEIKKKAQIRLKNISIDEYLKAKISDSIMRYLRNFRLLNLV
ncbi:tagatose-6-phosphate kinase [Candidatus Roizmanbacteria bacterium RIFCSPLOWO2_12_FULL_40_12]|uniref:Tagatose-6-phosphate kinase n=1 Tax=Candidatus Roizmanbacteria bacterium RIFCSPLOWO2_01_FULL_40_42 TaxID=1802066 RepID=A0A1F7J5C3_9BACT|nr:MAG: tagatose-6-phosphate kinase [Candidatus Roizmanbacteria bacterium RIFCSPHIGHO2_01_FULL_40_98]OGK28256.1 MAG: tagatose-6-phosphate kinase [Candidatus Roizmanbacteria bacterium RIFCSPHIGHO2_02_FULL_40_53]OGK30492.1 MAG: tagatose-6-phosphate kinase [Candidatus Roizmanbacteria bacterium RIFCSPHIGHO2_12_41_18]OGK36906.1 MAG: tagatose-6-phosphate kinase [Candidatus Roizmanbacteria bacterium RIFCSPHIGHO2_12_FULL_40_130]OGK50812.1 MAG: tagatose-6-phosphate kinase [Candidatus Roizmanbacteria bac